MGTPGDKSKQEEVVRTHSELDEEGQQFSVEEAASSFQTSQESVSSTMGVIGQLPEFGIFSSLGVGPSLSQTITKPESYRQHLEQATIEDYYSQSKYYSSASESLQTFPSFLDQPGPSGLQTPKAKSSTSLAKVKRRKPEKSSGLKTYTCLICHRNFSTLEKLSKHQQSHSSASPFKCEHCKKSFTSKFKLVRHSLIHSDRKPFSCTVCERTFHRKDHLKNHIKVHSPSKQVHECEKEGCKKQYTSLLSYKKHLAVHSAEEGNRTCLICSASFDTKDEILYHLKIHAGSRTVKNPSEKKYTCEYCDRRFFTKKDVRRHLVVHTGMRDFLCQFCPQRFGRKDHLVRHIKKSHNKKYVDESSSSAPASVKSETITHDVESTDIQEVPLDTLKSEIEYTETSVTEHQEFETELDFSLEGVKTIFEEENLVPFEGEEIFLSSTAAHSELEDLGSEILQEIESRPSTSTAASTAAIEGPRVVIDESLVLTNPNVLRLLHETEETNLPLPGFSQTFQPPPPPKK